MELLLRFESAINLVNSIRRHVGSASLPREGLPVTRRRFETREGLIPRDGGLLFFSGAVIRSFSRRRRVRPSKAGVQRARDTLAALVVLIELIEWSEEPGAGDVHRFPVRALCKLVRG